MTTIEPYWADETCALYLGDCREVLPALDITADLICADPPYGETSLAWDHWPEGWLDVAAKVTRSLWCFGSLRMYLEHAQEFAGWKLSQDIIWEKHNGSGFARDRFRRVHEQPTHWYRGPWADIFHEVPRSAAEFNPKGRTRSLSGVRVPHTGEIGPHAYTDDGTRLARSVLRVQQVRRGISRTEKPPRLLAPMITYACPTDGLVIDPFAGSGSSLKTARSLGCRAVGIELCEAQAEQAALGLSRMDLFGEAS